ncbi:MAG: hypothetical protein AABZ74_04270 [Cyanobacteriota bacterium]
MKNKGDEKKLSDDYVKEVKNFKGIHNIDNSSILNLTESLDHFDNSYFNISESPRTSTKTENHYLKTETKESEIKLRDKILKSEKKNLTPVDLIKSALEVTKGDYHKAVLTLHNSLKSIAYDLRKVEFDTKNNTSFFNDNSTFIFNKINK